MHTLAAHPVDTRAPTAGRLAITALVALAEAGHLGWEWTHGGIVSHHLLANPDLPALWNGWGLLLLPAIAWIASARLVRHSGRGWRLHRSALLRLTGALMAGIALSIAFATGRADVAGALFPAIVVSGIALRAYRAEYLLGFVLGMAYTFGGVLPTLIGGVIALLSAAMWLGVWPVVRRVVRRPLRS